MYSLLFTRGKMAPGTTGMSVRPMISIRRKVWSTSSSRQASGEHGDSQHIGLGRIDQGEDCLHVRAARAGGVLIDDDLAASLRGGRERRNGEQKEQANDPAER